MAHIEGEILIERPIDEVFDFVADERNEPGFNPRMLQVHKLTPGPIAAGTRFLATTRSGRRVAEMTIEITAYERPTRLASSTQLSAMDITGVLTFGAVPGGTRMRWSWEVSTPRFSRLMAPIVAHLGQRQERVIWTNLKRLLERPQAPGVRG